MAQQHHCIIIGSGFSGLCMAIKLQEAGFQDFLILEKAGDVGGTWRENHYPGAECDVPSALYSYSFERKTDWDYQWSEQSQILDYIHHVADKHALRDKTRFNSEVVRADYDEGESLWRITLATGETLEAHYLVSAVGQLHKKNTPDIPGAAEYRGIHFHSADWKHDVDLAGKSVGVIGNAASAVQFVPPVAQEAASMTIFQRSPNWLAEKLDRPYTDREKERMRRFPFIKTLSRLKIYLRNELLVFPALKGRRLNAWLVKKLCLSYLHRVIKDPEMRRKLTPDYQIGAKRILTANGYYEALARDNVELVTEAINNFYEGGIETADGVRRDFDVVIYGTGFVTNPFLDDIEVHGRDGQLLSEHWTGGAHAYLGVATNGFPNLFFLYGPNTNLGHNSILLMSEAQVRYIVRLMEAARQSNNSTVEVRGDVESDYNREIQARLQHTAWAQIEDSWYKTGDRVTNNWPGSVMEYRRVMKSLNPGDFALQ